MYIIISDIHGAAPKLAHTLARHAEDLKNGAKLVVLGDIYNHGPRNPLPDGYAPMQVAAALNEVKDSVLAVKGNCDSEVDEMISEFDILPERSVAYNGRTLKFTHGHKCNPSLPDEGLGAGDVVFYGHFHRAAATDVDGVKYICVGAIGICPKDEVNSYAILDGDIVRIMAVEDGRTIMEISLAA